MIPPIEANAKKPAESASSPKPPAPDQAVRRFKALLQRQTDPDPASGPAPTLPFSPHQPPPKRIEAVELAMAAIADAAQPISDRSVAPTIELGQAVTVSEAEKVAELSLRLDHAHAKPAATQLFLQAPDASVTQALLSKASAEGAVNITLVPAANTLAADAIEELRRRLAARGVMVARLHFGDADERPGR